MLQLPVGGAARHLEALLAVSRCWWPSRLAFIVTPRGYSPLPGSCPPPAPCPPRCPRRLLAVCVVCVWCGGCVRVWCDGCVVGLWFVVCAWCVCGARGVSCVGCVVWFVCAVWWVCVVRLWCACGVCGACVVCCLCAVCVCGVCACLVWVCVWCACGERCVRGVWSLFPPLLRRCVAGCCRCWSPSRGAGRRLEALVAVSRRWWPFSRRWSTFRRRWSTSRGAGRRSEALVDVRGRWSTSRGVGRRPVPPSSSAREVRCPPPPALSVRFFPLC